MREKSQRNLNLTNSKIHSNCTSKRIICRDFLPRKLLPFIFFSFSLSLSRCLCRSFTCLTCARSFCQLIKVHRFKKKTDCTVIAISFLVVCSINISNCLHFSQIKVRLYVCSISRTDFNNILYQSVYAHSREKNIENESERERDCLSKDFVYFVRGLFAFGLCIL